MAKRKGVSIKDVARESKASLTTVSLVLNNRDRRISAATRERVLTTVDRLGYRPSRLAQGLQAQKSGILAILVPELRHAFADVYFGELISAIHDYASEAGYKVLLEVAHPKYIESQQHLEIFDRRFVDGMLCLGVTAKDTYLRDFRDSSRPVLIVNNYFPDVELNHVKCDYHQAGQLATKHLLELGHERIGLIHGAPEVQTSIDLRHGVEETLAAAGFGLPESRVRDGQYVEEGGAAAADALLNTGHNLTAMIAGNDKMAIGAMSAMKARGHHVPTDISIVGCDDIPLAAYCDPPLTTVHTPLYEIGKRACRRLLELLDGKVDSVAETHPISLTVRQSTTSASQSS